MCELKCNGSPITVFQQQFPTHYRQSISPNRYGPKHQCEGHFVPNIKLPWKQYISKNYKKRKRKRTLPQQFNLFKYLNLITHRAAVSFLMKTLPDEMMPAFLAHSRCRQK